MKQSDKAKLFAYLMAGVSLVSGCTERVNCSVKSEHVHEYVKDMGNGESIVMYIGSENKTINGFSHCDNYIEVTDSDMQLYNFLADNNLFYAKDNWDYLYNLMANNSDYLEYYYSFDTVQIYNSKDSYGRTVENKMKHHHEGWHTNPDSINNTGEIRLCHYKYYGYRVEKVNGKYKLVRSPLVDDIRSILDEYPHVCEDCCEVVYEDFVLDRRDLKSLTVNDFPTSFNYPNLDNKRIHTGKMRILV